MGGTKLSDKVESLGQNGFARGPRRRQFGGLHHGPLVVSVATAKQRYNKSSVNEDVSGHSPGRANIPSSAQLGRAVVHPPIRYGRRWPCGRQCGTAGGVRAPAVRELHPTSRSS